MCGSSNMEYGKKMGMVKTKTVHRMGYIMYSYEEQDRLLRMLQEVEDVEPDQSNNNSDHKEQHLECCDIEQDISDAEDIPNYNSTKYSCNSKDKVTRLCKFLKIVQRGQT
ncbi:hypothetical protein JTB14_012803 [Gonioctena quinquepunctata]|nr:hypothetical protein JTB14_012803 [Gonioctena quinquepunctata]